MMNWVDDHLGWLIVAFLGLLLGLGIWLVIEVGKEESRLMRQCMDDGKKEYECKAMLQQDVVPMIMPMPMVIR
jgi:hypothetical protein